MYIVDPHYSSGPHLKFTYLLKFTCNPKISACGVSKPFRHVQSSAKFESPDIHIPSRGQNRQHSAFLFSRCKQIFFSVYLVPHLSHFGALCG